MNTLELSNRTRLIVMALGVVAALAFINFEIAGKNATLRDGRTVLLPLAPRDPRSLLQGDYMALRYAMAGAVARAAEQTGISDGVAVIKLSENGEASFVAIDQGEPLADDHWRLRFRKRGESVRLASDAFFFEEGTFETYSGARFGELRVNEDGDAVLIGLRDSDGQRLGHVLHSG